ncbi:MAG: TraR/DksA C4-type zinc finger protein [bacterium]|nr:TraR/DksA C4-type zinc finger protein [bacterium]
MNKKNLEQFKKKLVEEKKALETELGGIGKRNPSAAGGWEATAGGMEVDSADENEVADKLEEIEDNAGIVSQLEKQLNEVLAALERFEKGTYGLCEVCGEPIEPERLEANPSSRISIKHAH